MAVFDSRLVVGMRKYLLMLFKGIDSVHSLHSLLQSGKEGLWMGFCQYDHVIG